MYRTVHLVQFIVCTVPCLLYSLLYVQYRASFTVYCMYSTVSPVQFIVHTNKCTTYIYNIFVHMFQCDVQVTVRHRDKSL